MEIDLVLVAALLIVAGVLIYALLDGFDLGIGILFLVIRRRYDRDIMVNTVAPVWDGNETWLVLGGAGLMALFPLAYSVLLEALYLPLLLMLAGLILRGVSFEFRVRSLPGHQALWDTMFCTGSVLATFFQGLVAGALVQGVSMQGNQFSGSATDCFSAFSVLCGAGLLLAYSLLGAAWLVIRTGGPLQQLIRRTGSRALILFTLLLAAIVLVTAMQRSLPQLQLIWPGLLSCLIVILLFSVYQSLKGKGSDRLPFELSLLLMTCCYAMFILLLWPGIIPPSVSLWQAAAPVSSLKFALCGMIVFIPLIVLYSGWSYSVFRGKVTGNEGYH